MANSCEHTITAVHRYLVQSNRPLNLVLEYLSWEARVEPVDPGRDSPQGFEQNSWLKTLLLTLAVEFKRVSGSNQPYSVVTRLSRKLLRNLPQKSLRETVDG